MAQVFPDRVAESGCTWSGGTLTLSGTAVDAYRTAAQTVTDGDLANADTADVVMVDASNNWVVYEGMTYTSSGGTFTSGTEKSSGGTIGSTVTAYVGVTGNRIGLVQRLTRVDATITTANLTATVNAHHVIDISGMTAQRDLVIPAGNKEGDIIEFVLATDAPATAGYELCPRGDTGVTIDWLGTESTATVNNAFRYLIKGEGARLRWDATDSKWILAKQDDGRIPVNARVDGNGGTNQSINDSTWTVVAGSLLTNAPFDNANVTDTTNGRIYPRRDCVLVGTINFTFSDTLTGDCRGEITADTTAGVIVVTPKYYSSAMQGGAIGSSSYAFDISADDYIYMQVRHTGGTAKSLQAAAATYIDIIEIL